MDGKKGRKGRSCGLKVERVTGDKSDVACFMRCRDNLKVKRLM